MYMCFIDESGTPPKRTAANPRPYFVIAGVIIHEAQWHGIAKELATLCSRVDYKVYGEIKWRHFGRQNDDRNNAVAHLDQERRDEFRRSIFSILTKRRSVKIVACVTDVRLAYKQPYIKDEEDIYFHTYKPVSERYLYFLQDMTKESGAQQLGIMVADHRGKKQDDGLRSSHHRLLDARSAYTSKYDHYLETIFLTPSHHSVGIQFADMVAGAIGRGFNSSDWQFLKMVRPAIRSDTSGQIQGRGVVRFPTGWIWEPPGGSEAPR